MTEKEQARQKAKECLQHLMKNEEDRRGQAFFSAITAMPEYQQAKVVFCYLSVEKEPQTARIIEDALRRGKTVCAPVCIRRGVMRARRLSDLKKAVLGAYQIPVPPAEEPWVEPETIDFAVVPCVACGKDGTRLGHGAGFYDRFLEQGGFYRAAICHSECCWDTVPTQEHDLLMDAVVTENAVYRKGDPQVE